MKKILLLLILLLAFPALAQQRRMVAKTDSMQPNIQADSNLLVDESFYVSNPITRFDVVLFERTVNIFREGPTLTTFVARVIALGGEMITIKNNKVYIDGRLLKEPFKIIPCQGKDERLPCANFGPYKVPRGEYFLLADNRGGSEDSRLWEPRTITRQQIKGKVVEVVGSGKKRA